MSSDKTDMKKTSQSIEYRLILKQFFLQSSLFVFLFVILITFQNCSGQPEEVTDAQLSSTAGSLPFAFDAKVDHVSYMSCSNMPAHDPNAFFSFKVGAYETGAGLKLNDAFWSATTALNDTQKVDVLGQSPINGGANMQLSIRNNSDLQQYYSVPSSISFANFMTSLSDPAIASVLVGQARTARSHTFSGLAPSLQKMESRISFTGAETYAQDVRNALQANAGALAITFNQPSQNSTSALAPTNNSSTNVFGSGFALQFRLPTGYFSGPARTLASVAERDLSNNQAVSGTWDCSQNFVFKIVRQSDLGVRITCNALNLSGEPTPQNATQTEMYQVMRRVLPASSWALDLVNKCAVPRTGVNGLCYGADPSNVLNVQYNAGTSCSGGTCPHFVSVCKKR